MAFKPSQLALDLWNLLYFVCGDGSWKLRPHESKVLNSAISYLADDVNALVVRQLQQRYFVERTSSRINILRYYAPDDALRIQNPEFLDLLFRIQIIVDGEKEFAHVTFYKGYLFSIEFKKPGRAYIDKELVVVGVVRGNASQTYTRAIDRATHGRTDESGVS